MAVVPRIRKNETVYYAANKQGGRVLWERVGTDKREAKRRDAAMKKEIAAGVYVGKPTGAKTVDGFARQWLAARATITADDDRGRYENHVAKRAPWFVQMRLEDLRIVHTLRLAKELEAPYVGRNGETRTLGPKSHANIFKSLLGPMFRDARLQDLMARNVMELPRGTLGSSTKKRKPYSAGTVQALITNREIRPDVRMFVTLLFYTGARLGEVSGLRFSDYDNGPSPLGSLRIEKQYDGQKLKTEGSGSDAAKPREVPVLPFLAAALEEWWAHGFEFVYRRKPTKGDLIVPRISDSLRCHNRTSLYALFQGALECVGAENRTVHATRNTYISIARRGGARDDVLKVITHNPKGSVIDVYTEWQWHPLCEAATHFETGLAKEIAREKKAG